MPWLVLLLALVWLLDRLGCFGGRRRERPVPTPPSTEARDAAQAWSSYDGVPDRSNGLVSDDDQARPHRAYEEGPPDTSHLDD